MIRFRHTKLEPTGRISRFNEEEEARENRGGFSWSRIFGVSAAKARISRRIGIPLSRNGHQQKIGRMVTGGGRA